MIDTQGLLTVHQVAQRLGRSLEQVRRYLREGKLRGQRIGNQWFMEESAIQEYIGRSSHQDRRWQLFERVNRRREEIRQRWERLGIQIDAAELVREVREERP